MAPIGFIGLGNMRGPTARTVLKAGHKLRAFDLVKAILDPVVSAGAAAAKDAADAAAGVDIVITMLPAGEHVRTVYTGEGGVIAAVSKGALLIDSSTIDVETARAVSAAAAKVGLEMLDAPVSGGGAGAEAATLTFMVAGPPAPFDPGQPILHAIGKTIAHPGPPPNAQPTN